MRKNQIRISATVLIFLTLMGTLSVSVSAGYREIIVYVSEKGDGPIPGARVQCEETGDVGITCSVTGKCIIKVPHGTYTLKVTKKGYNPETVINDDPYPVLDVKLEKEEEGNVGPEIISSYPSDTDLEIEDGEKVTFEITASDPEGGLYRVTWKVNGKEELSDYDLSGDIDSESWSYTFKNEGSYTVTAVVEDNEHETDSVTWNIRVGDEDSTEKSHSPELSNAYVEPDEVSPGYTGYFEYYVTYEDKDGDKPDVIWVNIGQVSSASRAFEMHEVNVYFSSGYKARYRARVSASEFPDELTPGSEHYFYIYCSVGECSDMTDVIKGPVVMEQGNHSPELSNAYVEPDEISPGYTGYFEYYVTYEDKDGDKPDVIWVNIGQVSSASRAFEMHEVNVYFSSGYKARYRARVSASEFPDELTPGSEHYFYIYCSVGECSDMTDVIKGPVVMEQGNHSPELSNAYVEPDEISPGYTGYFEYYVTYEDKDGDKPDVIWVNIGQVSSASRAFEMHEVNVYFSSGYKARYRARVSASEFPDELTPGSEHYFYIYCADGEGSDMTDVIKGPVVMEGAKLSVSVSATPSVVDAGGSSTIRVTVKFNGEPISDAQVTLEVAGGWFEDDNHATQVGGHTSGDGTFTAIWHTDDPSEYIKSRNHLFTAAASMFGYVSGSDTTTITVNPLSDEKGKVLIITEENIQLPEEIDTDALCKLVPAWRINDIIKEYKNYFQEYDLIIYFSYSWNNTLEQVTKNEITEFAQKKPTIVYADANETVEIPLFDITYDGMNKEIKLGDIPRPRTMKTSYKTIRVTETDILDNVLTPKAVEILACLLPGSDGVCIASDFAEDGPIWGLVGVVEAAFQKAFVYTLPPCIGGLILSVETGGFSLVACIPAAKIGGAYLLLVTADILKDVFTVKIVSNSITTFNVEEGTLYYKPTDMLIENVQCIYDPACGYHIFTKRPEEIIYTNGEDTFTIKAISDTYFSINDESIYGKGLCNYPCGTSQDTVEFIINEQGFNLKRLKDDELEVQDNQKRSYVFSNPAPLILNDSGMTGVGYLEGNKTSFTIENSGNLYANEPTASYQLPQPTEISVGEEATISIKIQNTGNETITQLWLGLDIYRSDGTKVENTKTPIADEPPPYGTGVIGLIEFSNQGLGLAPGASRTFIVSYEFDISVTGHKYKEGVYTYGFRAWMYGYPGQDGAIPLGELKEVKLTIGGEREEAPFIRSWLLYGPFTYTTSSEKAHNHDYIGETTVQPNSEQESDGKTWKRYYSSDDYIDLSKLFSPNEYVVGYAHTYIYSPLTQTVQLRIGSDDAVKIWVNGSLVHENYVFRAAAKDQDIVSITLNSGWNRLLIRVLNGFGPWGFYARFTDKNGNEVKGLQYQLDSPVLIPEDSDDDGTPDDQDQCPYEPGPSENQGCPQLSEPTGTIKVSVRNKYNDRLEGAAVYLDGEYQSKTNRSGFLQIDDVPEGYHTVSASMAGYEDASAKVKVEAEKSTKVELYLGGSTGTIKVYVLDDSDNELPGAAVYLDDEYKGITDEEGYLRIEHVPEGSYTVKASKSGYDDDSEKVQVEGGKIVRAYLYLEQKEKESGTIKVYVRDDSGNGLSGASVYLDRTYKGKTDSSGYLWIYDVPEGSYTVKASKSGYDDDSEKVRARAGKTETVSLLLRKEVEPKEPSLTLFKPEVDGLTVSINGTSEPGTPGATITRIHWEWGDGFSEDQWFPASHTYKQSGTYAVIVTSYQSDGLSTTETIIVKLEEASKTGSLEVYVTDDSGMLLSGASVYLDDIYQGETGRGYLRIDNIPEGHHTVAASMQGYLDAVTPVYVPAGSTEQVHLKLGKVEDLQLELWTDRGCGSTYTEGEQITLYYRANRDCFIGIAEGTPGGGGIFLERKQVVGGQIYTYSKVLKGAGTHEFVIAAEDKSAQCIIYVEETPQPGNIIVYVTDDSGNGIAGSSVYVDGSYQGETGVRGDLRIDNVLEGYHTVKVSKSGYEDASATVYVTAGKAEPVNVQLEKEVEDLQLELWTDRGCGSTYTEGEQITLYYRANRDCFIGIAEGTPGGGGIFLERKQVVGGQIYTYSKVLKGAGTHEFVIAAEDKSAQCIIYVEETPQVGSIEVYANLSGASVYLDGTYRGNTDRGGYLRIDNVPEGNHTVVASMAGFIDASANIYVTAGSTEQVHLQLEREVKNGSLEVYVTDTSGTMLSGANVYLDGTHKGVTGRGYLRIDDVPEGNHTVKASMSGYKDASTTVSVTAGSTAQVHLQLEKEVEDLYLELWTDRGCGSTYTEGEQITLYYRANRDCFIGLAEGTPGGGGIFLERNQVVGGQTYTYSKVLKGAGTHEFVIAAEDKNAQCIIYVEENTPNIHLLKTNISILWSKVVIDFPEVICRDIFGEMKREMEKFLDSHFLIQQ